ncbi:expressed unknown protein [Seminavis robusta]|uniref:Uncharacterized protein n=1 Tax=Seminavis robusta TaxID=568900 RepID=A0A9N8EC25_9STRA|nr:expressed unknown protein [Seminavis robusta]|eukprot:Sro951_g223940.1 n/a (68) ;mRNA; r:28003-28282
MGSQKWMPELGGANCMRIRGTPLLGEREMQVVGKVVRVVGREVPVPIPESTVLPPVKILKGVGPGLS